MAPLFAWFQGIDNKCQWWGFRRSFFSPSLMVRKSYILPMSLFSKTPFDDDRSIELGVLRILDRADELGLGPHRVWSLAELHPDADDYEWLQSWARALRAEVVARWLNGKRSRVEFRGRSVSGEAAIGLLLLFLFAERARRDASESNLWSVLASVDQTRGPNAALFRDETQWRIFNPSQNYPRPRVQDSLEAAAYQFNLRHVFSQAADVQAWRGLIFLQFGFSLHGAKAQLPNWLAGFRPQGVSRLFRGTLRAESFRGFWNVLTDYRQGLITDARFRAQLQCCPWVLPEWISDIAAQCHRKRGLGTRSLKDEEADREPEFAEKPEIVWRDDGLPYFRARFKSDELLIEESGSYQVFAGPHAVGLLLVDESGARLDPNADYIEIPSPRSSVALSIRNASGVVIASMALNLWDPCADITLCSWNGKIARVLEGDAYDMSIPARYAILTGRDLECRPVLDWRDIKGCAQRLHLVDSEARSPKVYWDEKPIWSPQPNGRTDTLAPIWEREVRLTIRPHGKCLQPSVTHPANCKVRWARALGTALEVEPGTEVSTKLSCIAAPGQRSLTVALGIDCGTDSAILRKNVQVFSQGAWLLCEDGWEALDSEGVIETDALLACRLRVDLGDNSRSSRDRWSIVEGHQVLTGLPQGTLVVSGAAGLGSALRVHPDRFHPSQPDLILGEVRDSGIIRFVETLPSEEWCVRLARPYEPDSDTKVVWWSEDGKASIESPIPIDQLTWKVATGAEPFGVGVAFRGERMGAWWSEDWWLKLSEFPKVLSTARLMRWFRPPLMSSRIRQSILSFMRRNTIAAVRGWLTEQEALPGLQWRETHESQWRTAVRELLWDWRPTKDQAVQLAKVFGTCAEETADSKSDDAQKARDIVRSATITLARWHPLLMARMLYLLCELRCEIADQVHRSYVGDENLLWEQCCAALGESEDRPADKGFVRRSLVGPCLSEAQGIGMDPDAEHRVLMAIGIEPFRRVLAISLLREIARRG